MPCDRGTESNYSNELKETANNRRIRCLLKFVGAFRLCLSAPEEIVCPYSSISCYSWFLSQKSQRVESGDKSPHSKAAYGRSSRGEVKNKRSIATPG